MAKERDSSKSEGRKLEKEEKKKKKRSEEDGVRKSEKKDKKEKKARREALAEKALNEISSTTAPAVKVDADAVVEAKSDDGEDTSVETKGTVAVTLATRPVGALVPFANPLADEKAAKKVFKSVKKAAANRTLKRGVKEVVKALRKSTSTTAAGNSSTPIGVVVLAADISPMDVISHIPVLCEDHGIPYIYVTSRAELGMAGQTKRPTSVVMVVGAAQQKSKKSGDEEASGDWDEVYKALVKTVQREGQHVKI